MNESKLEEKFEKASEQAYLKWFRKKSKELKKLKRNKKPAPELKPAKVYKYSR